MQGFFNFRGATHITEQVNNIMDQTDIDDDDKLQQLLKLDYLKTQVGVQINHKLVDFL